MRTGRILALWLCAALFASVAPAQDCAPVDFLTLDVKATGDPVRDALQAAYPGARLDRAAGTFTAPDGTTAPFQPERQTDPASRLDASTIGDQFHYAYPLSFDLTDRVQPFHDPGRPRNDAFFRALYFDTKADARRSLDRVDYRGKTLTARFQVTRKHCVSTQLAAALDRIKALSPGIDVYFDKSGGSFNWRVIAGTDRLSAHSFGISIDLNTELGQYWRWSGAQEGHAGTYTNKIPAELVAEMERYGFIWGGKWHHFDGMHFEYRPEMILYTRLTAP